MIPLELYNKINKTAYSGVLVEGSTIKVFKAGAHNLSSSNIYEFSQKCVEFCIKNGYRLISEYLSENCVRTVIESIYDDKKIKELYGESRAEVEINASTYVYENFLKTTK